MRITVRNFLGMLLLAAATNFGVAQDKTETPAKSEATAKTEAAPDAPAKVKSDLKIAEEDPKPKADPQETWKKLTARKLEIFNTLQKLKREFEAASGREAKIKVRDQYTDLIREFEVEISPQLLEISDAVYQGNPENQEAAELVMKSAFQENQFDKSAEISGKLLASKYAPKIVQQMAAQSLYAIHKFEDASALFADLQANNKLDVRYERFVDDSKKYIELWKAEQEIREKEAKLEGDQALPRVAFNTSKGKVVFELFEDHAPNTVANFISLVEGKKYDGIKFHRVERGFVAQGGRMANGDEGPGYSIKCECHQPNARMHFRGSLSMAHAGRDTGGSQFFITHLPTAWLNRNDEVGSGHTVFGRIVEGLDIAMALRRTDSIETAVVLRKRPHDYKPEIIPDADVKKDETPVEKSKTESKPKEESKPDETKKADEAKKPEEAKPDDAKKPEEAPKSEDKKPE